jgi:hypothetical protein
MTPLRLLIITLLLFFTTIVLAQTRYEHDEMFRDANSYFFFEDYEEALALYLRVYPFFPDNYNLDFRIGFCYLSIPGNRHKAIPYLERAAENTTRRYNEESIREQNAPLDAIFYLGNAYFINNQLDKAEQTYNRFHELIRRQRQYDMNYFEHQRQSIVRSRTIQNYPINFIRSNLGPKINDRFANFNPVVSGDGNTLAYTTRRRFYQAVYVATREGDGWSSPKNITIDLVVDGNCQTLSLSYAGDELYLFKEHDHVGDIYVSRKRNGSWTPMVALNSNVNTHFYETHACVSPDGTKLYFTSNRIGGYGGLDIYVSEREPGGDWGPARNLGPNINTRFNENTPFLTPEGNTLFFSSEGHNTMGGYDIFFSQLQSGQWSKPINLGYPLNTTDDDLFYQPIGDGARGLMALFDDDGFGEMDIYQVELFLPKYQRSIITSNDLYQRTTELPLLTLVVDTLNLPGVALLDPTKTFHQKYLDQDKRYKLFFEGKGYDLRDQSKLAMPKSPTLAFDTDRRLSVELTSRPRSEEIMEGVKTLDAFGVNTQTVVSVAMSNPDTTLELAAEKQIVPWSYTAMDTSAATQLVSVDAIMYILERLADKQTKAYMETMLKRSWQVPPSLLMLQASRMVRDADSLGLSHSMAQVFAVLLDNLSAQERTRGFTQTRPRIISTQSPSSDEEFFFWFQKLKRNASPELSHLLDYSILTDPSIFSFQTLWSFISRLNQPVNKHLELEFVNLMAQSSFEEFFMLTTDEQIEVSRAIASGTRSLYWQWIALAGIIIMVGMGAGVIIKRRNT